MTELVGVDGCRGGWIAVRQSLANPLNLTWAIYTSFREILMENPHTVTVAVDVPIGLPDLGSRECDLLARRILAPKRSSSVFPAPLRASVAATSHADASAARFHLEGKKMSIQAWAIIPKIREVDQLLRANPSLALVAREVHPEVSFCVLAGAPLHHPKKKRAGKEERLALLRSSFGAAPDLASKALRSADCATDDVLDAFVCLWSARRIHAGTATSLPSTVPRDQYGLPMSILA